MAFSAIQPKNLILRFRNFLLGRERPDFIMRMSFLGGMIIWLYLASWHLLSLLAVLLRTTLNVGYQNLIHKRFIEIGDRYEFSSDPENMLIVHSSLQLVVYFVMLTGLILIYRRVRLGLALYVVPAACSYLFTLIILGNEFLVSEFSFVDFVLLAGSAIYFTIGILLIFPITKRI